MSSLHDAECLNEGAVANASCFDILISVPGDNQQSNLPPSSSPIKREEKRQLPNFGAWQFAWELGYTIAIPIVLFAFLGRWADGYFNASPWFLLAGVVLSVAISSALVYRKVSKIIK